MISKWKYLTILIFALLCTGSTIAQGIKILPPVEILYLKAMPSERYAIFPYDPVKFGDYGFEKNVKATTLSKNELAQIESIFARQALLYNKRNPEAYGRIRYPRKYLKEIVAAINSKGEKIVFTNCFCSASKGQWQKVPSVVRDGGRCNVFIKNQSHKKQGNEVSSCRIGLRAKI